MDRPTGIWPQQWFDWRAGLDCPMCDGGRPERHQWGARFYTGANADGYLQNEAIAPDYSVVVFRGQHVADLVDLDESELAESLWGSAPTVPSEEFERQLAVLRAAADYEGSTRP